MTKDKHLDDYAIIMEHGDLDTRLAAMYRYGAIEYIDGMIDVMKSHGEEPTKGLLDVKRKKSSALASTATRLRRRLNDSMEGP